MPTSARYWRVRITAYSNYPAISEIEFAALGAAKFANNTVIESSHFDAGTVSANAFDGTRSTAWAAASTTLPQWVGMDFGTAKQVDVVRLRGRFESNQLPTAFVVESSSDGSTWSTEWTVTGQNLTSIKELRSFPRPDQGKVLWGINVTAVDGGSVWAMSEVEFRIAAAGADQTAPGGVICGISGNGMFSGDNSYPPSQAIDNSTSTFFYSNNPSGLLMYEFGAAKAIAEVALTARSSPNTGQSAKDFTIVSSVDGMNWTTEQTVSGETGWTSLQQRTFSVPVGSSRRRFPRGRLIA